MSYSNASRQGEQYNYEPYTSKNPEQYGKYNTSEKSNGIQRIKAKYNDMNKTYKQKATSNFQELKKLPEGVSSLRQTINFKSDKNSKNTDGLSPLRKNNQYKKDKIDLRATVNYSKTSFENYDKNNDYNNIKSTFSHSRINDNQQPKKQQKVYNLRHTINHTSSMYEKPDQKGDKLYDFLKEKKKFSETSNPYSINTSTNNDKQKQESAIDFDRINKKLQNNTMMLQQLKRLKQQKRLRQQMKNAKGQTKVQSKYLNSNPNQQTQQEKNIKPKSSFQQNQYTSSYNTSSKFLKKKPQSFAETLTPTTGDTKKKNLLESYTSASLTSTQPKSPLLKNSKYNSSNDEQKYSFLKQKKQTSYKEQKPSYKYTSSYDPVDKTDKPISPYLKTSKLSFQKTNIYNTNNGNSINGKATLDDFILGKNLGEGKFGTVYIAMHKSSKAIFAIKKVPKQMIKTHMLVDQFILQLKIQSFFMNDNILQIYGFFDDKESIYLILQFMEQGTLFSYLKRNKTLQQNDAAIKVKQLCLAVNRLHQQGVAHRDIKPENIVMTNNICKLCDFGWSTICNVRRKTFCGTFDYAAPEILQGVDYDYSVDLWCIGILAYELLVGKAPFYNISRKQTMKNIMNVDKKAIQYPSNMSNQAKSFIENLLLKNPQSRMKGQQMLEHPWLKNAKDQK